MCIFINEIALADEIRRVEAEYTYYAPETMSVEEAKRTALDRAKIQAIADEFGTVVSQSTSAVVSNQNGESDTQFFSIGGSDVKGEWIETIGEPEYNIQFENHFLVVTCSVKGKAREIESAKIDFIAKPLRNGTSLKYESTEFKDGDDLYLYFKSPTSGFLSIYLIDHIRDEAYCILPYKYEESGGSHYVEGDKEYILFSKTAAEVSQRRIVDEYTLSCQDSVEINTIYVIFSPDEFSKGYMTSKGNLCPKYCTEGEYMKWLTKLRKQNNKIGVKEYQISIKK